MPAINTSPFAPLQLSQREVDNYDEVAHVLIAPVIGQFEAHMNDAQRHIDPARWKLVKERENVHVYKERSAFREQRSPSTERYSIANDMDESRQSKPIPTLLTVGTIHGDLYDTMYGVTNPTAEMMHIKGAYMQDGVVNAALLARLKEPTKEDPFLSLSVKWCIKGQALHLRTLVNNRDLVFLEATGLTRLPSSGEVIGYQMLHSVDIPEAHTIPGCLRGRASLVMLYRDHGNGVVEMFGKGFVDPKGPIARTLIIKSTAESMLVTWRTIQTAQLKKLAYALRRRDQHGHASMERRLSSPTTCSICSKSLASLSVRTLGKKHQCKLCLCVVCAGCRVKKELASMAPKGTVEMHTVSFCVACIDRVKKMSAFDIAVDELVHKDGDVSLAEYADTPSDTASDTAQI